MKVRDSEVYQDTMQELGHRGDGVVVATDTGVDNEHRSLNDFDDQNDEPDIDANVTSIKSGLRDTMLPQHFPTRVERMIPMTPTATVHMLLEPVLAR